jgi:hypothetical protein
VVRERNIPTVSKGTRACLHLDGEHVGDVVIKGWDASWTYGVFEPAEAFAAFAPVYGGWSLLMHEDEHRPLDPAAAEALREAERRMDRIRARVYFPDYDAWHDVAQLNIDGGLIEWKEV